MGWLYIDGQVAAPIRVLDVDMATGVMGVEVAGKFIPDRADLRREVVIEYAAWRGRRLVRCLGAERIGTQLLIEAVDVGRPEGADAGTTDDRGDKGEAEDWLIVAGRPVCRAMAFTSSTARRARPKARRRDASPSARGGVGHCMMHLPREAWRDLRVGEQAPLAAVGATVATDGLPRHGTITPLLAPTPLAPPGSSPAPGNSTNPTAVPEVKLVRLREREVYHLTPLASDWADDSTLVVARVDRVEAFGK